MMGICIGTVIAYDSDTRTAEVRLRSDVRRGDRLYITGPRTDLEQRLVRLFQGGAQAKTASRGEVVAIPLIGSAQEGDDVFRLLGRTA